MKNIPLIWEAYRIRTLGQIAPELESLEYKIKELREEYAKTEDEKKKKEITVEAGKIKKRIGFLKQRIIELS